MKSQLMHSLSLVEQARSFATDAHGQASHRRKYTGEPYICHPAEVAEIVADFNGTPEQIAAAWLHDTVEDTGVTHEEIQRCFGPQVASLVLTLTNTTTPAHGNRATRKAIECQRLAQGSDAAATIKLADILSNTKRIVDDDPKFACTYIREKVEQIEHLRHGDSRLWGAVKAHLQEQMLRIESYEEVMS